MNSGRQLIKLLSFDFAIVRASASQVRTRPIDLLTVLLAASFLGYIARARITALTPETASTIALGVGGLGGFAIMQFVTMRLRYHRTDGPLTHLALVTWTAGSYALAIALAGLCGLYIVTGALGLFWPLHFALGVLAGMSLQIGTAVVWPILSRSMREYWPANTVIRPMSNLSPLMCVMIGAMTGGVLVFAPLPEGAAPALSAGFGVLAIILWGNVQAQTVKFMSLVGHRPLRIVHRYTVRVIASIAAFASTLGVGGAHTAALVAVLALIGGLFLCTSRAFAYLLYPKQMADWAVSIIGLAIAMIALAFPFAAPLAGGLALVWLGLRARGKAWMIP